MTFERPAVMQRFGGKPYVSGGRLRCVECNGLADTGRCQTCGAVSAAMSAPSLKPPSVSLCARCSLPIYYDHANRRWTHRSEWFNRQHQAVAA